MPRPKLVVNVQQTQLIDDGKTVLTSMARLDATRQRMLWNAHLAALDSVVAALREMGPTEQKG